jgi:hypothetical protein
MATLSHLHRKLPQAAYQTKNATYMILFQIDRFRTCMLVFRFISSIGQHSNQTNIVTGFKKEYNPMPDRSYLSDQPATYRILVYGTLDEKWSGRMGDMRITHPVAMADRTVLIGKLTDQAALFGVLNSLYALGFFLLMAEHMDAGAATDAV